MGSHFDRFKLHVAKSLTYAAKHGGVAHLCRRQSGSIGFHMNSSRKANARIIRRQILRFTKIHRTLRKFVRRLDKVGAIQLRELGERVDDLNQFGRAL